MAKSTAAEVRAANLACLGNRVHSSRNMQPHPLPHNIQGSGRPVLARGPNRHHDVRAPVAFGFLAIAFAISSVHQVRLQRLS
jgi:hypothetical protein